MPLKVTKGQNMSILLNKNVHVNFWKKFFPALDTFWSFQLKLWLFLNFIYQNQTLCKAFDSKYDTLWNFRFKTSHVSNFLVQNLTRCKKTLFKNWHVAKLSNRNLNRCLHFISQPGRFYLSCFRLWYVLKLSS